MKEKLIDFRKLKGLTIMEMSEKIGISASFYEKIERGDRNPSYNFLVMIKDAFPELKVEEVFFKTI